MNSLDVFDNIFQFGAELKIDRCYLLFKQSWNFKAITFLTLVIFQ